MQDLHGTDLHAGIAVQLGDADTDIIEMEHYDSFRKEDGEIHICLSAETN